MLRALLRVATFCGVTVEERIGARVHQLLWEQRKTQRDLYVELGVTRFTLHKKMRGEVGWSASDIAVAAEVLGVTPNDLYGWDPAPAAPVTAQYQQTRGGHHGIPAPQPAAA
jgi:hypothetical protein